MGYQLVRVTLPFHMLAFADLTLLEVPLLLGVEDHLSLVSFASANPSKLNAVSLRLTSLSASYHRVLVTSTRRTSNRTSKRTRPTSTKALNLPRLSS